MISNITPTIDSLNIVNIDLIGEEPGYVRLHHRGCGHICNVKHKDIGRPNWFICSKHKVHNFGQEIEPRIKDRYD